MAPANQIGETTRSFFDALKDQPLSIALVVMNFLLVAYLFYSGSTQLEQRQETASQIINWQKDVGQILGNCVSIEVTKMMLESTHKITDTMLAFEQAEINRMQRALDREREVNMRLTGQPAPAPVATPIIPPEGTK